MGALLLSMHNLLDLIEQRLVTLAVSIQCAATRGLVVGPPERSFLLRGCALGFSGSGLRLLRAKIFFNIRKQWPYRSSGIARMRARQSQDREVQLDKIARDQVRYGG